VNPSRPGHIEVVIDELALSGVAPGDRQRVAAALGEQLRRSLVQGGLPRAWQPSRGEASVDLPRTAGGALAPRSGSSPEALGGAIARAVYHPQQRGRG